MGTCALAKKSMKEKAIRIEGRKELPKAYYLHRHTATIFQITERNVIKQEINHRDAFPSDSAIGLLSTTQLLLGGGTSPTGELTTKVFEIELETRVCIKYPSLLEPMKLGNLIAHSTWIYYVGGISIKSKSPLHRFDIRKKKWELLEIKEELDLKYLLQPGTFLLSNKIMFVGGQWKSKQNLQMNQDMFSIDLATLQSRKEDLQIFPSLNGMLGSNGIKETVLVGGWDTSTSSFSRQVYRVDLNLKIQEIKSMPWDITENYPVLHLNSYIIVSSYPNIAFFTMTTGTLLNLIRKTKEIFYSNLHFWNNIRNCSVQ